MDSLKNTAQIGQLRAAINGDGPRDSHDTTDPSHPAESSGFRVIDPEDYRPCMWSSHYRDLDENARRKAELGPEVLLQLQLNRVYWTFVSIDWDAAPHFEGLDEELQSTIHDFLTSIGQLERYLSAPLCPCCAHPMILNLGLPTEVDGEGTSLPATAEQADRIGHHATPSPIPRADAQASPKEEDEQDEEFEEGAIRFEVEMCIACLFRFMHTAVWIGRLRYVQAAVEAIHRLDHLLERMIELSMFADDE